MADVRPALHELNDPGRGKLKQNRRLVQSLPERWRFQPERLRIRGVVVVVGMVIAGAVGFAIAGKPGMLALPIAFFVSFAVHVYRKRLANESRIASELTVALPAMSVEQREEVVAGLKASHGNGYGKPLRELLAREGALSGPLAPSV